MDLIVDRSSPQMLAAFGSETLVLDGRDGAWVAALQTFLAGRRPTGLLVGVGPGSFAGIRASIACLQGLGIGWGLQPRGFPSAAVLALAAEAPEVTVVGDARRGTLWAVHYRVSPDRMEQQGGFRLISRAHFQPSPEMVSADAGRLAEFGLRAVTPRAELLGEAVRRLGLTLTADPLPIYLHPAVGAAHAE